MSTLPYSYKNLLSSLERSENGERLAHLSLQTKIEKFLLAEFVFSINKLHPDLEASLEDRPRRDFTVRRRSDRTLVEWIEAKMCYSDCVARNLTGKPRAEEYAALLAQDAIKQRTASTFSASDQMAVLSTALFVVHRDSAHERQKYYPKFSNRGQHTGAAIVDEALSYCRNTIPKASARAVAEEINISLDEQTRLFCFVYR